MQNQDNNDANEQPTPDGGGAAKPEAAREESRLSQSPVKRLLVFQLKLALDALRDFALSPVAIVATIMDMVSKNDPKSGYFGKLMRFGRETDREINLFEHEQPEETVVDNFVERAETIIVKEYQQGNLSAKAKSTIERTLNTARSSKKTP